MRFVSYMLMAIAALTLSSTALQAAPIEFATFNLVTANQPFTFTNNGGTSGTLRASNVPVLFDFTSLSGLPTGDHPATLNIIGTTFTPSSFSAGNIDQRISGPATLSILENGTGKNLLTLTFTGDVVGSNSSTTATLSGADTAGSTVVFSSDFGTFTPPGNSYNLNLTTLRPFLSTGPGNFLNSFVSNINGSFSANFTPAAPVAVPEPGSVALLTGIGTVGAAFLRRRKQARNAA